MTKTLQITHDETFLRRVRTAERVAALSTDEVKMLRDACDTDAYAAYGYARWLWTLQPTKQSATEARRWLLRLANDNGAPADAVALLATTYRYGGCAAWDEVEVDTRKYTNLRDEAIAKGSVLAAILQAKDRLWGRFAAKEPERVAEETERRLAEQPDGDPVWHCVLAYAYDQLHRVDEAIAQYEAAIKAGETSAYADLGWTYMLRGNVALGDSLMEEGIERGVAACHLWQTDMLREDFEELPTDEQQLFHETIKRRTEQGVVMGEGNCAYYLGQRYRLGDFGFQQDPLKALPYLERGILLGDNYCPVVMADMMEDKTNDLPQELRYSSEQTAGLRLTAVRRASDDWAMLGQLRRCCDLGLLLRHQPEIQREWQPLLAQVKPYKREKTPIEPSVILIWPTGHLDVVEADVERMASYGEMARELLRAEGLDAIQWTARLDSIAKAAELDMGLAMYVDRDAEAKQLPDNMIGTLLYGQATELRGPIFLTLEDEHHECHSFSTMEDLTATYNEIKRQTGGLLIIDNDDDGRWDAFA